MNSPDFVLTVFALVSFVLAAAGVPAGVSWRDAGFAFLTATLLF